MTDILSGSLAEKPFYEILDDINKDKLSGILTIQSQADTVVITFEMGLCVQCESQYPDLDIRLGQLLIARGFLSDNQLDELLEKQKITFIKFGQLACQAELISSPQLSDTLEDQSMLIIFKCMTWTEGVFHFREEELISYDRDVMRAIELSSIIASGPKILKSWNWIQEQLFGMDIVPTIQTSVQVVSSGVDIDSTINEDQKPVVLTPEQENTYNLVNGVFSVKKIVETCHQFAWLTLIAIIELKESGVINIPTPEKSQSKIEMILDELRWHIFSKTKFLLVMISILGIIILMRYLPFNLIIMNNVDFQTPSSIVYTKAQMDRVQFALLAYKIRLGKPVDFLRDLVDQDILREKDLHDAWGSKIYYQNTNGNYILFSGGKDRKWATDDEVSVKYLKKNERNISFFPDLILTGKGNLESFN